MTNKKGTSICNKEGVKLANRLLIQEAYTKLFFQFKRKPSNREIADITGLHIKTVGRHLRYGGFNEFKKMYKPLTHSVVQALYNACMNGKAAEVKLWLQFIEDWSESSNLKHSGELKFERINFIETSADCYNRKRGFDE